MNETEDFPFRAEYAKSGRAGCKQCASPIQQGSLRLAAMVQSSAFDGKVPRWYHFKCFFLKQRPKSVQDIEHYDSIRFADQKLIQEKMAAAGSGGSGKGGKGKGGKKAKGGNSDFNVETAKSARAACRHCEEKIIKDEIRISKLDYDDEKAKRFGPIPRWHHLDCFLVKRVELEWFEGGEDLPGFNTMSGDHKKMVREKIKKMDAPKRKADEDSVDGSAAKKPKVENGSSNDVAEKQNKKIFYYRDHLEKTLLKKEMAELLEFNDYYIPSGESNILDLLCDQMTFGVCKRCKVCKNGQFHYKSGIGYKCNGDLTEWTKCTNVLDIPDRVPFKVPPEFSEVSFLKKYKFKNYGARYVMKRTVANGSSVKEAKEKKIHPLQGMSVVIHANDFKKSKSDMELRVQRLGGKLQEKVTKKTTIMVTTKAFMKEEHNFLDTAKEFGVHCVPENFLDEIELEGVNMMIEKKNMAKWAKGLTDRVVMTKSMASKSAGGDLKSIPYKLKIKLKGGAAVDPDSGMEDKCHVYQRSGKNYNSVLGLVDLSKGTNSYYRLQILENTAKAKWYVFRSWGRIGTEIGGNKLETMEDLSDAVTHFEFLYEDKTGNRFNTSEFQKMPHKFYPLELDYGEDQQDSKKLKVEGSSSKLPKAIQKFVSLICDVDTMKNAMMEYEIDLKKMPLGKLSRRQLETAYGILSDALRHVATLEVKEEDKIPENELQEKVAAAKALLLDCSNRFYTLIPHDFGMNNPPLLDNQEIIKSKIEMVDGLREIEVSYSILKTDKDDAETKAMDPVDRHYKKLKTKMGVVDKNSDEFKMIKDYVKNTHAATHSHYKLEIDEIFTVERDGEKKRFKPFRKLSNRQLLWHGSRTTNYVGILSQGLRIAPPEAPVTGYMFGKGIYFADMVSKSANYCMTSKTNNTGMLMLCDVALGEMYERINAEYVEKLPLGKHSTKGLGTTCPDPAMTKELDDGVKVPLGKATKSGVKDSSLLYNEFVVYDIAQIKAQYLVQTKFKYVI